MFHSLFDRFFGCAHERTTFPLTPARRASVPGVIRNGTYVVCLDCGKELPYNWDEMKIMDPSSQYQNPVVGSLATKHAA